MADLDPPPASPLAIATARLDDGRVVHINPLTFGRARLEVGPGGADHYDDGW